MSKIFSNNKLYGPSGKSYRVFISHQKADVDVAQSVADLLVNQFNIPIYIDEMDSKLNVAVTTENDDAVCSCIDDALTKCTHLLGIISTSTVNSWWVPYEIGASRMRNGKDNTAFMILENVDRLPSYVRSAKQLFDNYDLSQWVGRNTPIELSDGQKHAASNRAIPKFPGYRLPSNNPTYY